MHAPQVDHLEVDSRQSKLTNRRRYQGFELHAVHTPIIRDEDSFCTGLLEARGPGEHSGARVRCEHVDVEGRRIPGNRRGLWNGRRGSRTQNRPSVFCFAGPMPRKPATPSTSPLAKKAKGSGRRPAACEGIMPS